MTAATASELGESWSAFLRVILSIAEEVEQPTSHGVLKAARCSSCGYDFLALANESDPMSDGVPERL